MQGPAWRRDRDCSLRAKARKPALYARREARPGTRSFRLIGALPGSVAGAWRASRNRKWAWSRATSASTPPLRAGPMVGSALLLKRNWRTRRSTLRRPSAFGPSSVTFGIVGKYRQVIRACTRNRICDEDNSLASVEIIADETTHILCRHSLIPRTVAQDAARVADGLTVE